MPAANTKHTWLAAIAAPILRQLPDLLRTPPVWEIAWRQVSEFFSEHGFHHAGCQRKETGVPSFSSLQAVTNRRPDIVQVLSEARLAKHISSLRRTACRPKSVRLHAFHAALVVDGSGSLAANIVGACGTVCDNGRGWLRRSCGKISSKPAASVVDQPLTDVRGKASPLFSWVSSECARTINHALILPLGVGCWLRRKRAGTFVAACCCRSSLAESVAYALSGSARPHCD
jgi:hypothetical protein